MPQPQWLLPSKECNTARPAPHHLPQGVVMFLPVSLTDQQVCWGGCAAGAGQDTGPRRSPLAVQSQSIQVQQLAGQKLPVSLRRWSRLLCPQAQLHLAVVAQWALARL